MVDPVISDIASFATVFTTTGTLTGGVWSTAVLIPAPSRTLAPTSVTRPSTSRAKNTISYCVSGSSPERTNSCADAAFASDKLAIPLTDKTDAVLDAAWTSANVAAVPSPAGNAAARISKLDSRLYALTPPTVILESVDDANVKDPSTNVGGVRLYP